MKTKLLLFALLGIQVFAPAQNNRGATTPFNKEMVTINTEVARWQALQQSREQRLCEEKTMLMPEWKNLGPNTIDTLSGRMLCLTFDPVDPEILYAGSGSGGLWKSVNGGDSWQSLTDALPSFHISAVAVNPLNNQQILMGTGIGKIVSNSLQPGVGVLKSNDGGQTWNPTSYQYPLSAIESTYELIWDAALPEKVFLAATDGLFVSEDGGDSWNSLISGLRIYDVELKPGDPQTMFVGVQNEGLRRSTDGGLSWQLLSNGLPNGNNVSRTNIAICESQPNLMYASMVSANGFGLLGLYKSTDGGDSWQQLNNAPNVHCQPNAPTSCSGWLFNTVGVAPDNPDIILLGGVQFWRSTDGGNTWTWLDYLSNGTGGGNVGLVYVDHWDIEYHPDDPATVYVCSDGGIQKSTNQGAFWERKSEGLINAMVYTIDTQHDDADFMIGGFHDHGFQKLDHSNDNLLWHRWSTNDGIQTIIDHNNPNILYGNIQNGTPYKSLTQGSGTTTTFPINSGITESGPWISPLLMHPEQSNILFTASNTRIYKTINGGNFWQAVANIPNVNTMAINPLHPDTLYAHAYTLAGSWAFYRSFDGGNNWNAVTDSSIPSWRVTALTCSPHQPETLYATRNSNFAGNDHIKVSFDNGSTWSDITSNLPDIRVYDLMVSPLNAEHLYVATDLGVYLSTDGGINWEEFNNNLPLIYTYDIDFSPADSTIRIATMGRGVWKTEAAALINTETSDLTEWSETLNLNVFPNPSSGIIQATFKLKRASDVEVAVLNLQGQVIQAAQHQLLQGQQELEMILSLPIPGIYFVRLTLEGKAVHRKIVIE